MLFLSFRIERMSIGTAQAAFWGFAAFMGLSLAAILLIGSSALQFAISMIGVLLFTALTAYDTQRVKAVYFTCGGHENLAKAALMGADAISRLHQSFRHAAATYGPPA